MPALMSGLVHALSMKPARAVTIALWGSQSMTRAPIGDELVDKYQAVLEHLLVYQDDTLGLRRDRERDAGEVRGERGPRAVVDRRDRSARVVAHAQPLLRRDDQVGAIVV